MHKKQLYAIKILIRETQFRLNKLFKIALFLIYDSYKDNLTSHPGFSDNLTKS